MITSCELFRAWIGMRTDQFSPSEKTALKMRHWPPSKWHGSRTGILPSVRKLETARGIFSGWKVCSRSDGIL